MCHRITIIFTVLMSLLIAGCRFTPEVNIDPAPIAPTQTLALSILQSDNDTHLIIGRDIEQIAEGTDLVVYSRVATGVEVPIALLRVFAKTTEKLEAQTVMLRPGTKVQPNLRVDLNVNSLGGNEMEFAPSIPADGYLIADHFIYLRSGTALSVGAELQTLKLVQPSAKIIGAVRASSPLLRVIASQGNIAEVELLDGDWPPNQTLVVVAPTLTPTATVTQVPTQTLQPSPSIDCVEVLAIPTMAPDAAPLSISQKRPMVCPELNQLVSYVAGNYLQLAEQTINRRDVKYIVQIAREDDLVFWRNVVVKAQEAANAGHPAQVTVDFSASSILDIRIKSHTFIEVDLDLRIGANGGAGLINTPGKNLQTTVTLEIFDGQWYITSSKALK